MTYSNIFLIKKRIYQIFTYDIEKSFYIIVELFACTTLFIVMENLIFFARNNLHVFFL